MNNNLGELIEYLDKKFSKIEEDIKGLKEGQGKLQVAVLENNRAIKENREQMATKTEVNKLVDAVDAYMKQGEDYRQEVVLLGNQVNRHERWIQKIAEKLDLKLDN